MAETVEEISSAVHESANLESSSSQPSDDIALHRICGWALKSAVDHLHTQIWICASLQHGKVSSQLELSRFLKLPDSDKCLLPKSVQYLDLDRGGLAFFKSPSWPWMAARNQDSRIIKPEILPCTWGQNFPHYSYDHHRGSRLTR